MDNKTDKVAVVLCGGGAKFLPIIGCLKAWRDLKLKYDFCYAYSAGAIAGSLFHANLVDKLETLWLNMGSKDVYKGFPVNPFRFFSKEDSSLYDSSPLLATLDKNISYFDLVKNPAQFWVHATDFYKKEGITLECKSLSKADLVKFIYASASVPIVFPMVEFEGRHLVDGGLSSISLINKVFDKGVTTIVVFSCGSTAPNSHVENIMNTINETMAMSVDNQLMEETYCAEEINEVSPNRLKFVRIEPDKNLNLDFLDFDYKGVNRKEVIKYGYDLALPILKEAFNI